MSAHETTTPPPVPPARNAAAFPLKTPLYDLHLELGARMTPFAGFALPVQYRDGIIKEHRHTREAAGLFDVSHMGQALLLAEGDGDPAAELERLVPADLVSLKPGQQRYTQFTNDQGGILDDLIVTREPSPGAASGREDALFLVVNAACKEADFDHIRERLAGRVRLVPLPDQALLALQGPKAMQVITRLFEGGDDLARLPFMAQTMARFEGQQCRISRCGYTGEDGVEIALAASAAEALARRLLEMLEVAPVGLGARDSLRLEAGLCLYGHDIDTHTTPVEAGLAWSIGKRRRESGGFPGDGVIMRQLRDGAPRTRIGLRPEGRAPAREGAIITDGDGRDVGEVTSGGFGPSLGGPLAMGYVAREAAAPGSTINLRLRGGLVPAEVVKMPFVKPGFFRG